MTLFLRKRVYDACGLFDLSYPVAADYDFILRLLYRHQVHSDADNVVADLQRADACMSACAGVDECYQLAVDMGGMGFIENNKALCMLSVLINTHMLLAAKENGVARFFYASSACVYNADKQRAKPSCRCESPTPIRRCPRTAMAGRSSCRSACAITSPRTSASRRASCAITTSTDPFGTWDGGREKAPAAICRKVIHASRTGDLDIEIWGDGKQTCSFMYIDDCLKGTQDIMASDIAEPINLGSSELTTINGLVSVAEEIAGVKLDRRYKLDAPKGVNGRNSDNTLIQQRLGWEPSIRLRDGLEWTYRWIHDEYVKVHG